MRKCKEQFHREQAVDDELAASTMLTRALLAEGKLADAKKEIESAKALATQSQNRLARFQFDLARARVLLTSEQARIASGTGGGDPGGGSRTRICGRRIRSPAGAGGVGEKIRTRCGSPNRTGCVGEQRPQQGVWPGGTQGGRCPLTAGSRPHFDPGCDLLSRRAASYFSKLTVKTTLSSGDAEASASFSVLTASSNCRLA